MAKISVQLVKDINDKHLKVLNKLIKKKFPADIKTDRQKQEYVVSNVLRKYKTLTSDLVDDIGKLKNKPIRRNDIIEKIRKKDTHNRYVRAKIMQQDLGKMYTFGYIPKNRATMPYYDITPLVIPIELYSNGFAGINLHYIKPVLRLFILENFHNFTTGKGDSIRFKLSWQRLMSSKLLKVSAAAYKRYLYSHVATKIIEIPEIDWYILPLLPSTKFIGETEKRVYIDTFNKSK